MADAEIVELKRALNEAIPLIHRIDERTQGFINKDYVTREQLNYEIEKGRITRKEIEELIQKEIDNLDKVILEKLTPIKSLVYGMSGLLLTSIIIAIVQGVIK